MKQKYISNFRSVFDILERLILFFVLCCTTFLVAQTAPNISYGTPVTFKVGVPITSLLPSNSGGFVPNALQGVTLFADATSGLSRPGEGVFDSFGNFFVANYLSSTILKITPAGVVSVFAGINGVVGNVDSSTGTTAKFSSPLSIAISSDNSLYVCDYGNSSIRKITASGVVSTFAGNNSLLAYPNTIVIDSFGSLFVSTMNHIIKVTQAGVITSIAGGGTNYSTVGTGLDASFYNISGMTIDSINNIYIVDTGYHNIRKMETVSGNYTLVPFAGIGGTQGFTNGPVASATFRYPKAIVIDASGNLFVADGGNYVIRKITSTGIVSTYAFNGTPGSINANLDNSSISDIRGMAIDASKNNIYIIGYFNIIQKLSRFGYSVSPALPSGLSINGEGTIIGTPTTVTAVANYTITATNTFGSNSAIVSISVILATPSITTQAAVLLSSTSVLMTGAITNLGATSPTNRGFVWGTSANPTIDLATKTSLGAQAAIGSFSSTITGLVPNTAYHVRGYATNSIGTDYSTDMVFSTNFNPVITPLFNGLNFIFNFAQQSLVSTGNLSLRLFGTVFKPNSAFQIRLYSNPVTLATGTIDATGTLDQVVTLPADTPVGVHHIALTTLLANNTPFQKEVYITIGADGSVTTDYNVMMMDIPENSTTVATILGSDSDTPAQALTYSISGGVDAAKFSINPTTGVLVFITAPNFESPTNTNANNIYIVNVSVTDNGALNKTITNTFYLNVTNVAEVPLVTTLVGTPSAIGANVSAVIVNDGGGGSITTKGFVYSITSTNSNPTIGGTGVTTVTGQMVNTTNMATLLTGLTVGTAYTFKAYAVNATGTGYTASSSFTTLGMNSPPSISYTTPLNYVIGASATISPINIGGIIPALNYGTTSVFAGSTADSFLDSPIGTSAKLNGPLGMAMDSAGNTYFADAANQRIRKITPAGEVSTIAGSGYYSFGYGWFSDNSTGTTATFSWPVDLAIDEVRNCLYVADKENNRIRKVSLTSPYAVTTIAGTGTSASTDGTGTTTASFSKPSGVKMDPTGTYLYVTDRGTNKIRKITIGSLAVSTIAGSGTVGTVDNYTGTLATFNEPIGIAVDANYIYVSDFTGNKIRKISNLSPFTVTTVAGSGTIGSLDATGTGATFYNPLGIQVDGAGNLLIADSANNKIRKITPSGVVSTIVKEGTAAYFNSPAGIVFNPTTGKAYVSEWLGDKVSQLELTGYNITPALPTGLAFNITSGIISGTPTTVTGPVNYIVSGTNYYGVSNTTVAITTANLPTITTTVATIITTTTASSGGNVTSNGGITLTAKGICWSTSPTPTVADSKTTESITTGAFTSVIAGLSAATTYYVRAYATNSIGTNYGGEVSFTTLINAPSISYTTPQNYIINTLITPLVPTNNGGEMPNALLGQVSTFAGTGLIGAVDGVGATASFNDPYGITIDASGNLFIGDRQNYKIRKITAAGVVSTIAGSGTFGSYNATGTSATFNSPRGVALDATGNIYVADYSNNLIRKISTAGLVSTLAGSGGSGLVDGNGTTARIGRPYGVVVDASGDVFVTDGNNYAIRKITPTGDVTTLAGNGEAGMTNGTGTNATFNNIRGITIDAFNNLYVTDTNKIRKITPAGVVTDFAGIGTGSNNGPIISASFNSPQGLAIDALGNIYVVDSLNNLIRKITTTGIVTTIAGSGIQGATDGLNTEASFYQPSGVAVDASGNVYITDSRNHKIRKISSVGYSISPALPLGLTLDATGSITGTPTLASPATDYTVTATNAGGSSTTTISLAVLETPTNEPPTASNQTLCQGALVSNLVATGTSLKWYDVATGGVSLNTSTPVVSGTYYVSQTNGGVESDRTTVVVTLTTTATWTGTASTDWNTASNWSCGVVPDVSSDVIIAATTFAPVISSNVAINTLTLNSNTSLIVPTEFNLTVTNYIHNSGTLTVQNNANLIQVDNVANTGNIIVNRNSAPIVRLDHILWSSPVAGQNLYSFSPATLTNRFYTYNTSTNSYVTSGLTSASTFIAGKGFAVRAPNNQTAILPTVWPGTFTGVPNNGTIPFTLNTTDVGYNLVGNPYPSTLDATAFVNANTTIDGTLYFYAHSLSMNSLGFFPLNSTNYTSWNYLGTTTATHILGDLHLTPEVPNGIIQVGQGFLVKALAAGNLNFTNAMRIGSNENQFFRTNTIEKHRMWLNLKTGAGIEINQILVGYITDATQAEDRNFDGLSFGNTGSYLSSKIATNDYVIQGRSLPFDSNDIVPLGFKADTAGTYSIVLTNKDGIFADTQDVFLKDNLTGITHDIKASSYDFASNAGTFDTRFSLIYTNVLANDAMSFTPNSVVVFKPNQWFTVNTCGIIMKDILVYDMAGRLIFLQSDINASMTVLKGLSPTNGVLLVKIVSQENEIITVKVSN